MSLALAGGAAVATPSDPFKGLWTSIDSGDSSNQTLSLGGGGSTRVANLFDDLASSRDPDTSASATGFGIVIGDTFTVTYTVRCHGGETFTSSEIVHTYDAGTNTLTDNFGTTWFR